MPEIKNTFLSGKMNKDLDERLVPSNQYIDALNIDGIASRTDNNGALQNSLGNLNKSNISTYITGGKVIGTCVDRVNDKIYWFITGTKIDAIAEYDARTGDVVPVLVDYIDPDLIINEEPTAANWSISASAWTLTVGTPNYATASSAHSGNLTFNNGSTLFREGLKYKLTYKIKSGSTTTNDFKLKQHGYGGVDIPLKTATSTFETTWIQGATNLDKLVFSHNGADLQLEDVTVQQVQEGFLNFDPNKLITGVNVLDGMLFWTDNNSEPKKINIAKCKAGGYSILNAPDNTKNWTYTTKNVDPNGNVRGHITESDITVIREYPLHAPKMSLFSTTKSPDLLLQSTCTTPLNTSYDYNKPYWLGTSEGGGSSDIIEYKGYIFGYLSEDIVFHTGADQHYRMPQMIFDGLYFKDDADNTPINYSAGDTGTDLTYPWHRRDPDAVWADGKGLKFFLYQDNPQNSITTLSSEEYEKRAFSLWSALENSNHLQIIKPDGKKASISSGTFRKDLYGDRFYLKPSWNQKYIDNDANGVRIGEKGDQVVFYDWFFNNNYSFWTYLDGNGNELVKPPGTSAKAAKDTNGISIKDMQPNDLDPIIQDNDEHFLSSPSDFGEGWTVGPGPNLSSTDEGIDYSQRTIVLGAASDTTTQVNSPSGQALQANGWQIVQRLVTGLKSERVYLLKVKIRLQNKGIATTQTVNGTFNNVTDIDVNDASGLSVGMYVVGVSSGALAGTPKITAISSNTITLDSSQTFANGITLSFADYYDICGIVPKDHTSTLEWGLTNTTDDVSEEIHAAGSDAYDYATYQFGFRLGNSAETNGGPNEDGVYILGGLVKIQNRDPNSSVEWGRDEFEATMSFFKRNGCIVDILSIESSVYASNDVRIQELVFEPRPDYEVGDVIKMTNTTKANNGDDINVTVKLLEENTKVYGQDEYPYDSWVSSANTRALTWADGHQRGAAIFDTTVDSAISNPNDTTYWVAEGALTLGKNEITCSGLAIDHSRKIRFKNTQASPSSFLTAGTSYQLEYKISGHADANNPEDAGFLVLNTANKFNTHYAYDPSGGANPSPNYGIIMPYHQKHTAASGNTTLHYVTFTPSADTHLDQIELGFAGWNGTLKDLKLYPLTKTEVDIGSQGSNDNRKIFNAEIVSIDKRILQLTREERRYWDCELIEQDPIYETMFPRFAYRWKYRDGEYSAISAFTEVAFLPGEEYTYDSKHGYNIAMTNNVRKVVLNNFQTTPKDVVEIDILYKESNSNSIYTITTITQNEIDAFTKYEITKEQLHALIESNQMLRPYDNVPRKAKAQEITSNRLLYGNFTQQYNIPSSSLPNIVAEIASSNLDVNGENFPSFGKSVKSIRNYQVGLSFLDKFGRQSPVFSNTNLNQNSLINIPQTYSKTANSIHAQLVNNAPEWVTHYKFFVKDSASEYHNISLDRFYQGENESHFWLSFSSSDFNKVQEDDYLILKKQHDSNTPIEPSKTLKYKVIAKQGSPPDFLRISRVLIGGRIDSSGSNSSGTKFSDLSTHAIVGDGLEFASQSSYGGSSAGYPQIDKTTFRLRGDIVDANSSLKEAVLQSQADRYIRIGKENGSKINDISNYYEILSVVRIDGDSTLGYGDPSDYYEFTLLKPLGLDASFIGDSYDSDRNLFLEYYGQDFLAYDSSFEGKFFVKVLKDADLDFHVARKQRLTDSALNIVNTQDANWAFIWEDDASKNTNSDKGQDTDNWLLQVSNFDWVPDYPGPNTNYGTNNVYNNLSVDAFHGEVIDYDVTSSGLSSSQTGTNQTANPFTATWEGTVGKTDYSSGGTPDTITQKFMIDQAWAWHWSSGVGSHKIQYRHYPSQDGDAENARIGPGFVIGNNYCAFRFVGIGNAEAGADSQIGTSDDTNSWWDNSVPLSVEYFDNYDLLTQLRTEGTKFRWSNDPTQTIYTIKSFFGQKVNNYTRGDITDQDLDDPERSNMGYRLYLQLDKPIVWSPTATIPSGFANNQGGTHAALLPYGDGTDGTSKTSTSRLEILEYKPSETTYVSNNPAVFEIEPKTRADLNLYYETSEIQMVLKDNMCIEALNNVTVNDGGGSGNYNSVVDDGTIYAPSGSAALGYIGGFNDQNGIPNKNDIPKYKIIVNPEQPNKFRITPDATQSATTLPAGLTIRISERDDDNFVKYFKDYILPVEVTLSTGLPSNESWITLDLEKLNWHNCFAFGNGVESNRIRDDFNKTTIDKGPRVSTTLENPYAEEVKPSTLIYSGIYNRVSSTNKLNEFIQAEKITKELNPEYGSIQKLFTRNTNVVAFCEDKIVKVLANKDALFNADGNSQLLSTNRVLGSSVPFLGEYGISKNPESFANYGYRVYFTDQARGAVLRLSADGLTPISDKGMSSYFMKNLSETNSVIGSYDEKADSYNLGFDTTTIGFVEKADGWTSFKSFLPESGVSLNGEYYTFKNGDIWKHHNSAIRNNFYGTQYDSSVKFTFNNEPSVIKSFNTINYEGTNSREYNEASENSIVKKGWYTSSIETDLQSGKIKYFKNKEGKWFNNIVGITATETNIDPKEFTSQGLGLLSSVNTGTHPNYKTLSIRASYGSTAANLQYNGGVNAEPATLDSGVFTYSEPAGTYDFTDSTNPNLETGFSLKHNQSFPGSTVYQRWIDADFHSTNVYYYITDIFTGLVEGNKYYISADIKDVVHDSVSTLANLTSLVEFLSGKTNTYDSVTNDLLGTGHFDGGGSQIVLDGDFQSYTSTTTPGPPGTNICLNYDFTEIAYHWGTNRFYTETPANDPAYNTIIETWGFSGITGNYLLNSHKDKFVEEYYTVSTSGWYVSHDNDQYMSSETWKDAFDINEATNNSKNNSGGRGAMDVKYLDYGDYLYGFSSSAGSSSNFAVRAKWDWASSTQGDNGFENTGGAMFLSKEGQMTLTPYKSYYIETDYHPHNTSEAVSSHHDSYDNFSEKVRFGLGDPSQSVTYRIFDDKVSPSNNGDGAKVNGLSYAYYDANIQNFVWQPINNNGFEGQPKGQGSVQYINPISNVTDGQRFFIQAFDEVDIPNHGWLFFMGVDVYELDPNDHWSLGAGATINYANDAGQRNSGNVTSYLDINTGADAIDVAQNGILTIGDSYEIRINYNSHTQGDVKIHAGTNTYTLTSSVISNSAGTCTHNISCAGNTNFKLEFLGDNIMEISSIEVLESSPAITTYIPNSWSFGAGWVYDHDGANPPVNFFATNEVGGTATGNLEAALTANLIQGTQYEFNWSQITTSGSVTLTAEYAGGSTVSLGTFNDSGPQDLSHIVSGGDYVKIYFTGSSFEGEIDDFSIIGGNVNWSINNNSGGWNVSYDYLEREANATSPDYVESSLLSWNSAVYGNSTQIAEIDNMCFEVTYEVYDRSQGGVKLYVSEDNHSGNITNTNGIFREIINCNSQTLSTNNSKILRIYQDSNFVGKIDNIEVKALEPDWLINLEATGGWEFNRTIGTNLISGLSSADWDDSTSDPDDAWTHNSGGGTVTKTAAGSSSSIFYPSANTNKFSVTAGKKYKITITASAITAGEFEVLGEKIFTNGGLMPISKGKIKPGQLTYTYVVQADVTNSTTSYVALRDSIGTGAAVFTGITVQELSDVELHGKGTFADEDGVISSTNNFSYAKINTTTTQLIPGNNYNVSFDWTRTSGWFEITSGDGSVIYKNIDTGSSGTATVTFNSHDDQLSFRTSEGAPFNGVIKELNISDVSYTQTGNTPSDPIAGFSSINMLDIDDVNSLTRSNAGIIQGSFTYSKDNINYPNLNGISIFKGDGIECKLGNFSITDITTSENENQVGVSEKWLVNISETDNTVTTSKIDNNKVVLSSTAAIDENLYIHSKIVSGIKYAVQASNFTVTSSDSSASITKTDLGVAGTYGNVIKINITRSYTSNDRFPNSNSTIYITVSESGDGVTLATDQ